MEACMKEMRNLYEILVRKPEGKRNLADLGIDGRIILIKWIINKQDMRVWTGFT
jgi:hypothetical protein